MFSHFLMALHVVLKMVKDTGIDLTQKYFNRVFINNPRYGQIWGKWNSLIESTVGKRTIEKTNKRFSLVASNVNQQKVF